MTDAEILRRIMAWFADDQQGYSQAIEILDDIKGEMDRRAADYERHFTE